MIKWIRASRLSIKNSLSGGWRVDDREGRSEHQEQDQGHHERAPRNGNSNARPVHLIITMIKWIRTSRLLIKMIFIVLLSWSRMNIITNVFL